MSWRDEVKTFATGVETDPIPSPASEKAQEAEINKYSFDKEKTYLVINGKVKEISSKSKYILDMLIIREED